MQNNKDERKVEQPANWKVLGQTWAKLTKIYTVVSETYRFMSVDPDGIVEFLSSDDGKIYFVEKLRELGLIYKSKVHGTLHGEILEIIDGEKVRTSIDLIGGELYIDSHKVVLCKVSDIIDVPSRTRNTRSIKKWIEDNYPRDIIPRKSIADFLLLNKEFYPTLWEDFLDENTINVICFLGSLENNPRLGTAQSLFYTTHLKHLGQILQRERSVKEEFDRDDYIAIIEV